MNWNWSFRAFRLFGTDVTRPVLPALYGLEDDQALDNGLLGWQGLRPRARALRAPDQSAA